jgi:hypothetical protein
LNKCSKNKYTELEDKYKLTQVENQTFESLVNKKNDTIKTQNVIILKTEKSLKNYTDTIFNLKKKQERKIKEVIAYYNNKTDTRVDSFFIPTTDTIKVPDTVTV